ncbi:hypothetical protein CR513_56252, partial [Mucuna pruriens]
MDEAEGVSGREREESTTRCNTDSASRVEEGSHLSRLSEAESTSIAYIKGNGNPCLKPLIIQYNSASQPRVPFIQVPARPIDNNNVVPWRYPTGETTTPPAIKEDSALEVTNIAETGGVIRSRRIFSLEGLWKKDLTPASKGKVVEAPKRIVMEGEAHEFLKMICHSDHHDLLLKVLNDVHVAQDITPEKFGGIINNITVSHHLLFSEDEVPAKSRSHNQPLHIIVKCNNYMIARVLVDNGSSLNVMPMTTLDKLYFTNSTLKTSSVVVRAFDESKWEMLGKITLSICIGPTIFDITFQVMTSSPRIVSFSADHRSMLSGRFLPPCTKKSSS